MRTNLFIIFLVFLSTNILAEEKCSEGMIEYIYKKKKVKKKLNFCFDKDKRDKYIYSTNCKGLKCKPLLIPEKRPVNISHYKSSIGSPGFKVCRELGGSPQIIKYKFDKKWNQSSRCIFNDSTFASNNLLLKLWKGLIIQ
ncbi:MAG: hypothetical protein GY909_19085 [Oligoflexia bacterium]|nr:hypothetical protein [Oligoflexia bacterium]